MHHVSKFSDQKPSVVIVADMLELLGKDSTVVMYRKRHAGSDAAVYYTFEQGIDMPLIPIVKKADGSFREFDMPKSVSRWDVGINYMHCDDTDQCENDAMILANLLFMAGVIDGYVGQSFGSENLISLLVEDTIDRGMFLDEFDPEPYFDLESKYELYFKDNLTDAFYPVEATAIWSQSVLEGAWYPVGDEMFLVREARHTHPELCHQLGIDVRKAMARIDRNNDKL